ncbi:uncharacterized protein LACBIDRAFT_235871, partial [Laccaria bicolor S238N-H82]
QGPVAFGLIPANLKDSTGDTMGGFGSAIALKRGTWKVKNGTFTGTLVVHPDRGYNVDTTVNYQSRQHEVDFTLKPYAGATNLDFTTAQQTLTLSYRKTTLQFDRFGKTTSGLDPTAVRPAVPGHEFVAFLDPEMPIVSRRDDRLVIDAEGLVANADGSYWVSDEYGPYIYHFTSNGQLIQAIQPPRAILPLDASGHLNFSSVTGPTTGRTGNQGFEGLTYDDNTKTLYAMLQSATIQDGGSAKTTNRYTRLLAFNVANPIITPKLVGEWVVPLPQSSKGKTQACSEIHFISPGIFLALSRDGNGRGGDDAKSGYKQADLFSISKATDIHNTKFDDPANPISPGGVLDPSITPAEYVSFVNYLDKTQLARFGLHNDVPNDNTLIAAKWESFALAPVNDPAFPNDYFLFTVCDNDFITTNGVSIGVPYNAGLDVDNQFLVYRLTLPSVPRNSVERSIGI